MTASSKLEVHTKLTAERERLADVLDHARLELPTGMFGDEQALYRAEELGLVERQFKGPLSFLSLSCLTLTDAGRSALSEEQRQP